MSKQLTEGDIVRTKQFLTDRRGKVIPLPCKAPEQGMVCVLWDNHSWGFYKPEDLVRVEK